MRPITENAGLSDLFQRFHAQLTFPVGVRAESVLRATLSELREKERRALGVFFENTTPDGRSVYLTDPYTPIDQSIANLLGMLGVEVKKATEEQVDQLFATLAGPVPELWDGKSPAPEAPALRNG